MRVGVELGMGGSHAVNPDDRRDTSQTAARRCHTTADARVRQDRMDRLVPRVEQMLDIDRRPRRPEPEALVRLVPDQPVANPGVAPGGSNREAVEVSRMWRGEVRCASSVRPPRRPDQRQHGRQPVAAQPAEDPVGATPSRTRDRAETRRPSDGSGRSRSGLIRCRGWIHRTGESV